MRLPRAFVDTGAQHTVLTRAAAEAAGVELAPVDIPLVGFASFSTRPGLIRRLQLGDVTLRDVPVYVGDSPALLQAGGQASLGIDLLHHLRVTMDYPAQQATIEAVSPADSRQPLAKGEWEIGLWTFSQVCLAQVAMPDGSFARTLIDTGNPRGTYLSPRWANRRLPDFPSLRGWYAQHYRRGRYSLADWQLDGRQFSSWPVLDTLPRPLERMDVVDLLLGLDLLAEYRVEIDLPARHLRLHRDAPLR